MGCGPRCSAPAARAVLPSLRHRRLSCGRSRQIRRAWSSADQLGADYLAQHCSKYGERAPRCEKAQNVAWSHSARERGNVGAIREELTRRPQEIAFVRRRSTVGVLRPYARFASRLETTAPSIPAESPVQQARLQEPEESRRFLPRRKGDAMLETPRETSPLGRASLGDSEEEEVKLWQKKWTLACVFLGNKWVSAKTERSLRVCSR